MCNAAKMSAYRINFDRTKYVFFDKKLRVARKNIMKFGIKSAILFKKDLIVYLFIIKSI